MGFTLSEHVAALDYDFGGKVKGTIPEPSSKAVNKFFTRLRHTVRAAGVEVGDESNSVKLVEVMRTLSTEQLDAITQESVETICELTQNHPTRAQLEAVGHRARQAFLGWLIGELNNPEGPRPALNTSPRALPEV